MKNIQKKWMLLVTATFVTFLGICYTFFKETSALEEKKEYCGIDGVRLSEGEIDFDIDVYEYTVTVSNYDNFDIDLVTDEVLNMSKSVNMMDVPRIISFSTTDFCGKDRVYTFKVFEDPNILVNKDNDKGFDYTFIFVIIIFILIAFNIYRMIRIIKGKKK